MSRTLDTNAAPLSEADAIRHGTAEVAAIVRRARAVDLDADGNVVAGGLLPIRLAISPAFGRRLAAERRRTRR